MRTILPLIPLLLLTTAVLAQTSNKEYDFRVRYTMVNAGHARISYLHDADTLVAKMSMNSNPLLSTLWQLADSIESRVDTRTNRLIQHVKIVNQGRYHRRYFVDFFGDDSVSVNGKLRSEDVKGVMDVPQLLHHLEQLELTAGDTLHFLIWDGKAASKLSLLVNAARKPLNLNPLVRSPRLIELSPLQSTAKSRKHGIRMRFWVREALPHSPVRMEIKTRYGDVELSLKE